MNSFPLLICVDFAQSEGHFAKQFDTDGNPWSADGGEAGKVEDDGVAFNLGYWFGVYHGFIGKER